LVGVQPDIIVTYTNLATAALRRETRTIPIVFAALGDPVASGIVARLDRPGGNVTGFATNEASLGGKWLELLSEIAPDAMVEIITAMQAVRSSDYVFPGSKHGRPLDRKNFERLLKDLGLKGRCTTHGFRQTFSNWGNNVNKTRYEIVERALSHKVGNKVGQAYWTEYPFAEHRALTAAWNSFLDAKPSATVTRLWA
jgi:hypothetical protein